MDVSVLTGQMLKTILNLKSKQISVEMLRNWGEKKKKKKTFNYLLTHK